MDAEKFELLEARIRETAGLVMRLREEKQRVEEENALLRAHIGELEQALEQAQEMGSRYAPNIDNLLEQLDSLHAEAEGGVTADAVTVAIGDLQARETKGAEEYFELGQLYEQQGQFEQAIDAYQDTLRLEAQNLEAVQRLAFLLEKLNRDTDAAPLWDKVWAMQEAQANPRRRRR
jgi:tetratricopeptide (TPR) repeat protein